MVQESVSDLAVGNGRLVARVVMVIMAVVSYVAGAAWVKSWLVLVPLRTGLGVMVDGP